MDNWDPDAQAVPNWPCPRCGRYIAADSAFCPFCGYELGSGATRRAASRSRRPLIVLLVAISFVSVAAAAFVVISRQGPAPGVAAATPPPSAAASPSVAASAGATRPTALAGASITTPTARVTATPNDVRPPSPAEPVVPAGFKLVVGDGFRVAIPETWTVEMNPTEGEVFKADSPLGAAHLDFFVYSMEGEQLNAFVRKLNLQLEGIWAPT
jgi:hypothetical protein